MNKDVQEILDHAKNDVLFGHYGEAIKLLKPHVSEGSREARLLLGIAYAGAGKPDAAAAEFSALSTLDPMDADALNNAAVVYRRQGRLHDAIGTLIEAIDIDPTKYGYEYNIGNVQKDLGSLRAALMAYAKVIEITPNFLPAYNSLGKIYEELGDYDKAVNMFRKGLALAQEADNPHGYLIQVLHFYNGYALEAKGSLEEAEAQYRAAMEALPDWVEPANNLGIIHSKQGKHDEAIAAFKHILKGQEGKTQEICYLKAMNNIGVIQAVQGKTAEAIKTFREALEADEKYVPLAINLAEALAESGDYFAASVELEKIIELVPGNIEARNSLGAMFLQINRHPQAIEAASAVLEAQPDNLEALCIQGRAHFLSGNDEEAKAVFEKILSKYSDKHGFYLDLAEIYFKRQEYKEAAGQISAYLEKYPKNGKAKLLLGAASGLAEDPENDDFFSIEEMWEKNIAPLLGAPKEIDTGPLINYDSAGVNRTVDESTEIFFYDGPMCITTGLEQETSATHESAAGTRSGRERMLVLLKQLKTMTADLPEADKAAFMENTNRMKLELIIEALESRTGLYRRIEGMQKGSANTEA